MTGPAQGGPRSWSFRPALLRGAQEWVLDGTRLSGPDRSLDLRDLDHLAWVDQQVQGQRITRLDLVDRLGRVSVALNCAEGTPADDPDRKAHRSLCRAVAGVVADVEPDLPVIVGEYGRGRLAMFLVGLVSLLAGLGILAAAFVSGVSSDRLAAGAAPILMLVVFGAILGWARRPWAPPPTIPAAALPALLLV